MDEDEDKDQDKNEEEDSLLTSKEPFKMITNLAEFTVKKMVTDGHGSISHVRVGRGSIVVGQGQ